MTADWQSLTAAALVLLTAAVFLVRMLRANKNCGCGSCKDCGPKEGQSPNRPRP